MTKTLPITDNIIYQEMMSHVALFSHKNPQNIGIIGGPDYGILNETLKHSTVTHIQHITPSSTKVDHQDSRVTYFVGEVDQHLPSLPQNSLDILIISQDATPTHFEYYFKLLQDEGILVQQSKSLFDVQAHKSLQKMLKQTGYTDIHFLSFPQPQFESGWRTALIAKKQGNLKHFREKDIFNRPFITRYYNFDIHKASLVLPEFIREELELSQE